MIRSVMSQARSSMLTSSGAPIVRPFSSRDPDKTNGSRSPQFSIDKRRRCLASSNWSDLEAL